MLISQPKLAKFKNHIRNLQGLTTNLSSDRDLNTKNQAIISKALLQDSTLSQVQTAKCLQELTPKKHVGSILMKIFCTSALLVNVSAFVLSV
jgi:hypothetical protein